MVLNRTPLVFRKRSAIWGGALAVGLAAAGWRSMYMAGVTISRPRVTLSGRSSIFRHLSIRHISTSLSQFNLFTPSSHMALTAPQPPPAWNHSAEDITRLTKEFIAEHRTVEDKIGALALSDCNFNSVRSKTRAIVLEFIFLTKYF